MACIAHGSNSPSFAFTGGAWHGRQRGLPRDYLRATRLCNASCLAIGTCAHRGRDHRYAIPRSRRLLPLPRCITRDACRLGTLHIRHVSCMEVGASVSPSAVPSALELHAHARLSPPGSATEASGAAWAAIGALGASFPSSAAVVAASTGTVRRGVGIGVDVPRPWDEGLLARADQPVLELAPVSEPATSMVVEPTHALRDWLRLSLALVITARVRPLRRGYSEGCWDS